MEPPPLRAELRLQTICMAMLTAVAVGFALYWLQPVMIPFVVAAFLAFALRPLVDALEVYAKVSRHVAACLVLLLAVMALGGLGVLVWVPLNQFTSGENLADYKQRVSDLLKAPTEWSFLLDLGIDQHNAQQSLSQLAETLVQNVLVGAPKALLGVISQSALVLVFLFFLLLGSVKRDRPLGGAWGEAEAQFRAYLLTMTALSAACGISVGIVLWILGVQGAALFGLLTFLLNFIPNVGSFIATVLPLPVVWMSQSFTTPQAIMAIAIPGAIQFAIGNFLQPKLMGNSMKLHPVVILMSLIFWGMLWGIVGVFFAVPITSIIRIACDRHELTKPVANLMAGRLDALREEPTPPIVVENTPS